MPTDLSYMPTVANLGSILEKIKNAATPPKFTHEFLKANLGFSSSNDRSVIKILKSMGFLTNDGTPTELYNEYRGATPGKALSKGVRKAYAPLFLSDEKIFQKSGAELLGIVKNTSGVGDAVAKKIAATFRALSERADWEAPGVPAEVTPPTTPEEERNDTPKDSAPHVAAAGALRLHHDIHLHLPPTSDVSVYRAIFQAMKSELV